MRAQAVKQIARYKVGPWMYNPAVLGNVNGLLGTINMGNAVGGTNWPGVAYDPETHTIYANANNVGITSGSLVPPPPIPRTFDTLRVSRASRSGKCWVPATAARLIRPVRRRRPKTAIP